MSTAEREKRNAYMRIYNRMYRKKHLEKVRDQVRARYLKNRDTLRANYLRWRDKDPERYAEYRRRAYERHRFKKVARATTRYRTELNFRIASKLRARFGTALRNNVRSGGAIKLLGCSIDNFRIYIQSKFEPEMTWENIHLDHIVPCSLFDLSKAEHQQLCFHFSNYQPLFAKDNIVKGGRISPDQSAFGQKQTREAIKTGQLPLLLK